MQSPGLISRTDCRSIAPKPRSTRRDARAVLNVPYVARIDKKVTPPVAAVEELLSETAAELPLLMGHVASDGA
jgi:hypothetical protein